MYEQVQFFVNKIFNVNKLHGKFPICIQLKTFRKTIAICYETAENILNKQSQTADKGWSSSLGVGRVLPTPYRKKKKLPRYDSITIDSDVDRSFGTN